MHTNKKTTLITSFYRSQLVSLIATGADFFVTIGLTEIFKVWYVVSTGLGNLTGAIISFLLGRTWAFNRKDHQLYWQAVRYGLTSLASMGLNTGGVYLLTENTAFSYEISKVIMAILVGITFNFLMFRYFVFK